MLVVLLTSLAPRLRHPLPFFNTVDFNVYFSAAQLVRGGDARDLYTGADTGVDPQKAIAAPGTPIYRAARAQGLGFVGLYVYPPILANLLLPLTFVPLQTATGIWLGLNALFLLCTGLLLVRLLKIPWGSWKAWLIVLPIFCFTPAIQAVADGQITVFLLLLWAAGLVLYSEDHLWAAGALFALATAIKLTPALLLLPFLIWRSWRVAGAFLATLAGLAVLCFWVDTPHASVTYFTRVIPAMSGAMPYPTNFSLAAAIGRFATLLRTGTVAGYPPALPGYAVWAGKATSAIVLLGLLLLMARAAPATSKRDRVLVLGLLSLMAPVLSPVSWFHAYATAYIAFVLLWAEVLTVPVSTAYLLTLTAVSLLLGTAVSENLLPMLVDTGRSPLLGCVLQLGQLLAAAGVVSLRLWRMAGTEADGAPSMSAG